MESWAALVSSIAWFIKTEDPCQSLATYNLVTGSEASSVKIFSYHYNQHFYLAGSLICYELKKIVLFSLDWWQFWKYFGSNGVEDSHGDDDGGVSWVDPAREGGHRSNGECCCCCSSSRLDDDGSLAKFFEHRKSCARVVCGRGCRLDRHEAPPSSQDEAAPGSSCSSSCRQLVTGLCTSRLVYLYKARIYVWMYESVMRGIVHDS